MSNPSLLLIPDRYKAGKLYSQIPDSGAGDLSFTRVGDTATRVNASGLIEPVLANIPRIDYTGGGCGKLLLEPQRTNLLLYSEQFDNAAWLKDVGLILTSAQESPTATPNQGWLVNDNSNSLAGIRQLPSITSPTQTGSVRIKKTTGTPAIYPLFDIIFLTAGVANTDSYFIFNTTTGDFHSIILGTPVQNPFFRAESFNDDWWVVEWGGTDPTGTQTQCQIDLYPAASTNGTTLNPSATGAQNIFGFQLEAGSYATSYIPTLGASVTRGADVASKTGISSLIGQTEGTLYAEVDIKNVFSSGRGILEIRTSGAQSIALLCFSNGNLGAYIINSTDQFVRSTTTTAGIYKLALAYSAASTVLYINGQIVGTASSGVTIPPSNDVQLGNYGGVIDQFGDRISAAAIYPTRLSNAQLAQLTTL